MGSEIDKIMDELSYNETKVILALKDVPMATPEQLVQKGGE